MVIALFVASVSLQVGAVADTATDPVAVYSPVLEHVLANAPMGMEVPVVIRRNVYAGVSGQVNKTHPTEMLQRLATSNRINISCPESLRSKDCELPHGRHISVGFGEVIDLAEGQRVKVLPDEGTPGVPLDRALEAIPDNAAVPATAAVDVVLHTPCPAPPTSDRCRTPDISIYRYFLDTNPNGTYRVVTRWLSGGS